MIQYAQQFLKYNQELGIDYAVEGLAHHAVRFDCTDTPMLTPESATIVLKKVGKLFPYAEKVIGNNPIEILLIEAQHEERNGEATAHFTPKGMNGSICIYQLQDDCTAAPEHIFLHELGTCSIRKLPEQRQMCLPVLSNICPDLGQIAVL